MKNNGCKFPKIWTPNLCGEEKVEGEDYCEKHLRLKCSMCGKPAIGYCNGFSGSFICGYPLCNECRHRH